MKSLFLFILAGISLNLHSQQFDLSSPDNNIVFSVSNAESLNYSVSFLGKEIIGRSDLGFEFRDEEPLTGNFEVLVHEPETKDEAWEPVVRSKHARIRNNYNGLHLLLREKSGDRREIDMFVRAYNDGVGFRFRLPRGQRPGNRFLTKELTNFNIPGDPKAWIVEYGGYSTSNEAEFFPRQLSYVNEKTIAGMPFLMEYPGCWVALTEAEIDNYAAFYIGTDGTPGHLTTKLVPLPGEEENGVKVRFDDTVFTPWRVIMAGQTPGTLIETEIIQNLNEPCAIADPSWIKPGKSAWDNWWSGDEWFVGVMNNSKGRTADLNTGFLEDEGEFEIEMWSDTRRSGTKPSELAWSVKKFMQGDPITVKMAENGGFAAVIRKK